jgi:YD repeat-containing protein
VRLHLDTHTTLWLLMNPKKVRSLLPKIESCESFVSSLVWLEMQVLSEIGRVTVPIVDLKTALTEDWAIETLDANLTAVTEAAMPLAWTRDPFDRLIVAHAIHDHAQLLTSDENILKHFPSARWK